MRYIIELSQKHVNEIKLLIDSGKYHNFAQFIATAVENQIYLERSEMEETMGTPRSPDALAGKEEQYPKTVNLAEEFRLDLSIPSIQPRTAPFPLFTELACSLGEVEEERCWLWGQINKILPLKLGLRVLLRSVDSAGWAELEPFRTRAGEVACAYGERIGTYEKKQRKKRDEKISAGLPTGKEEYKSKMRYKTHFLAFMRKDERLDGALPFLRFANLTRGQNGKVLIGFTDAGLKFASIKNPVVDQSDFEKSLSEEEISFYLEHISGNVKGEYGATSWLLGKLATGITDIEVINRELKREYGDIWKASDAVINTQRAGLMARMVELGLIDRVRKGIRVYYYISDRGKVFLGKGVNHA